MRFLIAMAFASAAAGTAFAADPTTSSGAPIPPQAQSFALLDTNRDGVLSFSEAFAHPQLSNAFNVLDSNADGVLSRSEALPVLSR
jgi:Ca2+-binding EF-hand superfamily protein